jgi:hypothetical protein
VNRVASLFAIVGLLTVALGLFTTRLKPFGVTITHGNSAYGFSVQFVLYGIAALFCVFTCLNSAGYIPFDKTSVQWHFWLSTFGVVLFIAGFAWLYSAGQRPESSPNLGIKGTIMAVSYLSSIPIFLIAQAWFAVASVRALLRMRHI